MQYIYHEWSADWQLKFNCLTSPSVSMYTLDQYIKYYLNGIKIGSVESLYVSSLIINLSFIYTLLMLLQKLTIY